MIRRTLGHAAMVGALCAGTLIAAPSAEAATAVWTDRPVVAPSSTFAFDGVSCVSAQFCVAVGWYYPTTGGQDPLIETWNGAVWSIATAAPPPVGPEAALESVSCSSTTFCVALGDAFDGKLDQRTQLLAEYWNGSTWSAEDLPFLANVNAQPESISCVSATFCKADGFGTINDGSFVLSYDGSAWTEDTPASPPSAVHIFYEGVDCYSTTFCAAVGDFRNAAGSILGLASTWNGSSWHADSTPSPGNQTTLGAVSCMTVKNCTAVAIHTSPTSSNFTPSFEHRNNSVWTNSSGPGVSGYRESNLLAISCTATSFCVTIGYRSDPVNAKSPQGPDAASYNGLSWTVEKTPAGDALGAISCPTKAFCMAVGESSTGSVYGGSATRTS